MLCIPYDFMKLQTTDFYQKPALQIWDVDFEDRISPASSPDG